MSVINFQNISIKGTVENLISRVDKLKNLPADEASKENKEIYSVLHSLYVECENKKNLIEKVIEEKKKNFQQINEEKVKLEEKASLENKKVEESNKKIAEYNARIKILNADLNLEKNKVDATKKKIKELEERKIELAKFWWVPFYNWYLVGRTLDDAITQIPRLEKNIGFINAEIKRSTMELATMQETLKAGIEEEKKINNGIEVINASMQALSNAENAASKDLALIVKTKETLSTFSILTKSAEEKNTSIQRFIDLLENDENLGNEFGAQFNSYKEAFLAMGEILDKYK